MELLKKKVVIDNLIIEITVHDLSFRMGFSENEEPKNHLYASLTAKDQLGFRIWSTPVLAKDGKVKAYSSVSEALSDAKKRIKKKSNLSFN